MFEKSIGRWVDYVSESYYQISCIMAKSLACLAVTTGWLGLILVFKNIFYLKALIVWYVYCMFSIGIGYHRYFSHRSFRTSRVTQFILAFLCQACCQGGVVWWASRHRLHHKECDTEKDKHSPARRGFWHAHVGWVLQDDFKTDWKRVPDLALWPELVFLNNNTFLVYGVLLIVLYAIDPMLIPFLLTAGLFVTHNLTYCINSATHVWGVARMKSEFNPEVCHAKNLWWLGFLTFGEGWHNNHHHKMRRANQGVRWYEFDLSLRVIQLLKMLGVVWDVIEDYNDDE